MLDKCSYSRLRSCMAKQCTLFPPFCTLKSLQKLYGLHIYGPSVHSLTTEFRQCPDFFYSNQHATIFCLVSPFISLAKAVIHRNLACSVTCTRMCKGSNPETKATLPPILCQVSFFTFPLPENLVWRTLMQVQALYSIGTRVQQTFRTVGKEKSANVWQGLSRSTFLPWCVDAENKGVFVGEYLGALEFTVIWRLMLSKSPLGRLFKMGRGSIHKRAQCVLKWAVFCTTILLIISHVMWCFSGSSAMFLV